MPAVFDSLVKNFHHTPHVAWRIAFIVPTILLLATAAGALFLCEDIPLGAWKDRHIVAAASTTSDEQQTQTADARKNSADGSHSTPSEAEKSGLDNKDQPTTSGQIGEQTVGSYAYEGDSQQKYTNIEVVQKPSLRTAVPLIFSLQALMLALPYACTFGGELAVNSILSSWYLQHFAHLGWSQTKSGQVAAIFGLLNVVTRPAGGFLADVIYAKVPAGYGVQSKKYWYMFLVFMQGTSALARGHRGHRVGLR